MRGHRQMFWNCWLFKRRKKSKVCLFTLCFHVYCVKLLVYFAWITHEQTSFDAWLLPWTPVFTVWRKFRHRKALELCYCHAVCFITTRSGASAVNRFRRTQLRNEPDYNGARQSALKKEQAFGRKKMGNNGEFPDCWASPSIVSVVPRMGEKECIQKFNVETYWKTNTWKTKSVMGRWRWD
jgi:hypothetical protein